MDDAPRLAATRTQQRDDDLNAAQYSRVKANFALAIEQPAGVRDAFVRQTCRDDAVVLAEVLSLLENHSDKTVLETSPGMNRTQPTVVQPHEKVDPLLVLNDVWVDNRQILRRHLIVIASVLSVLIAFSMLRLLTYHHAVLGYGVRIAALTSCLGCAWLLSRRPHLSLTQLRGVELLVMANVIMLISVLYVRLLLEAATRQDALDVISITNWNYFVWAQLIFIYGVFMPNTWQRAAIVLLPLAAMPRLVLMFANFLEPTVGELLDQDDFGQPLPAPFAAAGVAIYAAKVIHGTRLATFNARRLAQYELKKLIGEGGMGRVFEAEHLLLKRPCAIKLIQPERSSAEDSLQNFEREVRATARLTHPHTIEVFDYGQTRDGLFFYAMELLPGMNLRDLVKRYGPLPPARALHFLIQVCEALIEAHRMNLIHRDIKPANIFTSQRGGIDDFTKLLDFGLVHETQVAQPRDLPSNRIAGTPQYMSPEQVAAPKTIDQRTDIYSLGGVGYFLLTGRPPFVTDSSLDTMRAHVGQPLLAPSHHRAGIPQDLEQVIIECLEKNVESRIATAAELLRRLCQCQDANRWTQADAKHWWSEHQTQVLTEP